MQEAIRGESLDGWLFCNFRHRDSLTDSLLELDISAVSSRQWLYLVPPRGEPVKIVHSIEREILSSLPGRTETYREKRELVGLLTHFSGMTCAILSDPNLPVLSTVDAASAALFSACGIRTVSAATLVQRVRGTLDERGIESHERAAGVLYRLVRAAWDAVASSFAAGAPAFEGDIRDFMTSYLAREGLVTDHPPIVACGSHSGDPHYAVSAGTRGARMKAGDIVQFDVWAKESDGIYADISWIGYCGPDVPDELARRANAAFGARDLVVDLIGQSLGNGARVTGRELDERARAYLLERVPADALRHRTGHGIDAECHGSGVNLDSIEFPDDRELLEGSCFSVEPGVYFEDCGFRTEINVYIKGGAPVVSGGPVQTRLLSL